MARQWVVRPLAEANIEAAAAWYERQQSGLALRFVDAVDQVLTRIRETPLQFPVVSEVRRALLHTFPYAVYFDVTEHFVVILAVCTFAATHANGARGRSHHAGDGRAVHRRRKGLGALRRPRAPRAAPGLDGAGAPRNARAYAMAAVSG